MQPYSGHVIAPDKVQPKMFTKYRFRKRKERVCVSDCWSSSLVLSV